MFIFLSIQKNSSTSYLQVKKNNIRKLNFGFFIEPFIVDLLNKDTV